MRPDTEIAWAAGLFEGEGCITCTHPKSRRYRYWHLTLSSADRDVVERFARIAACGSVSTVKVKPGRKPLWRWNCTREHEITELLSILLPYLGERRHARAVEALNDRRAAGAQGWNAPTAGQQGFQNHAVRSLEAVAGTNGHVATEPAAA